MIPNLGTLIREGSQYYSTLIEEALLFGTPEKVAEAVDNYGQFMCDCSAQALREAKVVEGFIERYPEAREPLTKFSEGLKKLALETDGLYKKFEEYQRTGELPTQFSDLSHLLN